MFLVKDLRRLQNAATDITFADDEESDKKRKVEIITENLTRVSLGKRVLFSYSDHRRIV